MDAYQLCLNLGIQHPNRLTWSEFVDWRAYYIALDMPKGEQLTADDVRETMRAIQSQPRSAN